MSASPSRQSDVSGATRKTGRPKRGPASSSPLKLSARKTIRGQILLAFLAMSVITASLGYFAARGLEREGGLLDRTFDRSLMSINFARAAAADFNALEAAATRRAFAGDEVAKAALDRKLAAREAEMDDDLSVAVERAQSARAIAVAKKVQDAVARWKAAAHEIQTVSASKLAWAAFDHQASLVAQELELLVNYTAGDGFTYRQSAHATAQSERRFNGGATVLAVLVSGLIAWALSRRVVSPIEKASEIAQKIAEGDLGVVVPAGNADELGALLAAMDVMRGNIKSSMEREVDLRLSAQNRLAAALEGSGEGIVIVDPDGTIVLANAQASRLLEVDRLPLESGDSAERFGRIIGGTHVDRFEAREVALASGRWLRISLSPTQEGGSTFVFSDISLVREQQAALSMANLWLDAALANLSHGVCLFGPDNTLKVFNKRYCELFGLPIDKVRPGMALAELIDVAFASDLISESKGELRARLERRIAARRKVEHLHKRSDGRAIAVSHRPLGDDSWLSTYEDVTDRLQAAEKITYMARHDALTGLPNRSFFAERIETALKAAARGQSFALLCLDLDHFKEVNDTLGHPIGDELLRAVASRLREATRDTDMVARLGGDEFAIVQTIDGDENAETLATRIITALNAPFEVTGHPVRVGVSIGISRAPRDGSSYDVLLKNADLALYRAKADGRNGWRFFESVMDERQQTRRLIELDLREAIDRDQFELDYQPIIRMSDDRISAFEALLRWRHPVRGLLPPAEFVPIAEELGLITQIGDKVLRRACQDAARWPSDIGVAVNVSADQLRHGGLDEAVAAALDASGLSADRLTLEITESVLIANAQKARRVLDRCKDMGIKIAMDDFGTGYSSLSYLRSFPFDNVKIDKSFIQDVAARPDAAAIVRAVVTLCANLGMRTVAEGVETPEQRAFLRAEGCDAAQGFLFSKPVAARLVARLIRSRRRLELAQTATKAA